MVLASRERGKSTPDGGKAAGLTQAPIALFLLFGCKVSLNPEFAERAWILNNLNRHAPHERLYETSAGVIFAAIKERQLNAYFSCARFVGFDGNS